MSKLSDERELLSKPGDTILETIEHLKMSQVELAERMGKTSSKINDLISGKEPITNNTALLLETVLGISAEFWLVRETNFREKLSRIEQQEALEQQTEWLLQQPVKALRELGYLKSKEIGPSLVHECLRFYAVASPQEWSNLYVNQYEATEFRKSSAQVTALGSMAAWLRIGEIEVQKLKLPEYNKDRFKETLGLSREIAKEQPQDFASMLRDVCSKAGVALVYSKSLPKAPISGGARWISGRPLIQMTDRYKTNDHFWFTFFHEAAHLLLHGKKDVFIENFEGAKKDESKEDEANNFAANSLLPRFSAKNLPNKINNSEIMKLAQQYETHPGIVVGRLQHLNRLPKSFGNHFKVKVDLKPTRD